MGRPVVVLLGEHGTDEEDDGGAFGKICTTSGARFDPVVHRVTRTIRRPKRPLRGAKPDEVVAQKRPDGRLIWWPRNRSSLSAPVTVRAGWSISPYVNDPAGARLARRSRRAVRSAWAVCRAMARWIGIVALDPLWPSDPAAAISMSYVMSICQQNNYLTL